MTAKKFRRPAIVNLAEADETMVQRALVAAWRNTAPKRLLKQDPEA